MSTSVSGFAGPFTWMRRKPGLSTPLASVSMRDKLCSGSAQSITKDFPSPSRRLYDKPPSVWSTFTTRQTELVAFVLGPRVNTTCSPTLNVGAFWPPILEVESSNLTPFSSGAVGIADSASPCVDNLDSIGPFARGETSIFRWQPESSMIFTTTFCLRCLTSNTWQRVLVCAWRGPRVRTRRSVAGGLARGAVVGASAGSSADKECIMAPKSQLIMPWSASEKLKTDVSVSMYATSVPAGTMWDASVLLMIAMHCGSSTCSMTLTPCCDCTRYGKEPSSSCIDETR